LPYDEFRKWLARNRNKIRGYCELENRIFAIKEAEEKPATEENLQAERLKHKRCPDCPNKKQE